MTEAKSSTAVIIIAKLLWLSTALGAGLGAVVGTLGVFSGAAPQQGAAGALAAGRAIIPYVVGRSWDEITERGR